MRGPGNSLSKRTLQTPFCPSVTVCHRTLEGRLLTWKVVVSVSGSTYERDVGPETRGRLHWWGCSGCPCTTSHIPTPSSKVQSFNVFKVAGVGFRVTPFKVRGSSQGLLLLSSLPRFYEQGSKGLDPGGECASSTQFSGPVLRDHLWRHLRSPTECVEGLTSLSFYVCFVRIEGPLRCFLRVGSHKSPFDSVLLSLDDIYSGFKVASPDRVGV